MYIDIVVPNGNEEGFISMASKLGYGKLIFLYKDIVPDSLHLGIPVEGRIMGTKANLRKGNGFFVKSDENDRMFFESKKVSCIYELERARRGDFIHHRNSGLNQVLCVLAKKNGISIGFSFHIILGDRSGRVLGRMMQNARLCRKFGLDFSLASFARSPYEMRSPLDLASFGTILGFHMKDSASSINR